MTAPIETFEPCTAPDVPPDARLERIERRQRVLAVALLAVMGAGWRPDVQDPIRNEWGDELR
ncbi:MAG: hypothetical protein WC683_16125 [bacterium]